MRLYNNIAVNKDSNPKAQFDNYFCYLDDKSIKVVFPNDFKPLKLPVFVNLRIPTCDEDFNDDYNAIILPQRDKDKKTKYDENGIMRLKLKIKEVELATFTNDAYKTFFNGENAYKEPSENDFSSKFDNQF